MTERVWIAPQGELFPLQRPPGLLTEKRREELIPLLSGILAAAMTSRPVAQDGHRTPGADHDG